MWFLFVNFLVSFKHLKYNTKSMSKWTRTLYDTIDDQIDILDIDKKIQDLFSREKEEIPTLKKQLSELEEIVSSTKLSHKNKTQIEISVSELKDRIQSLEDETDFQFYLCATTPIIEEYNQILRTPVRMNFMAKCDKVSKQKQNVMVRFISEASKFVNLGIEIETKSRKPTCSNCKSKDLDIDDGIYYCVECGCEKKDVILNTSYKDINRVNITNKYTYEKITHFRDAIAQYQGKQNCTIDPKIYKDLIHEFKTHHLLVGDENTPKKERFAKITKATTYLFLKELGQTKHFKHKKQEYTKHYENINLIHYNLTGIPPDDIGYLEDDLLNDFMRLEELYMQRYKRENKISRKNFMNTQNILYQLLLNRRHKCLKEDFNLLKTYDRKQFHEDILKALFEELGWQYHSIL